MAKFSIGSKVKKVSGYNFPGEIRSIFTTRDGKLRYVVELLNEDIKGLLHIYNENQLNFDYDYSILREDSLEEDFISRSFQDINIYNLKTSLPIEAFYTGMNICISDRNFQISKVESIPEEARSLNPLNYKTNLTLMEVIFFGGHGYQ